MIEQFFTFAGKLFHTFSRIIMELLYPMASTDNETVITLTPNADLSVDSGKTATISNPVVKEPVEANTAPSEASKPTLTQLCTYMRDFEGKPGDPNYRNNNPLNCKFYYGGYLSMYEPVKISSAGFAIFKDYQTGWLYGFNMLKNKIKHHPDWTLYDLIADHAPASDNNPVDNYTSNVAKRLGVDNYFPLKNLVLV